MAKNKLKNMKRPESGTKFHEDVSDLISHSDTHTLQPTELSTRQYTIYLEKIKILISIQSTRHYTIFRKNKDFN